MAAWEAGWLYLAAGASETWGVTWDGAPQGLQFIAAEPRGPADAKVDVTAYGMETVPQFGRSWRYTYWVDVVNSGRTDTNFVLRGHRVD